LRPDKLGIIGSIAKVDLDVLSFDPTELLKLLSERRDLQLRIRIDFGVTHHHADPPHALGLLRAHTGRPADSRTANKGDELSPSQTIGPHCGPQLDERPAS